MGYLLMRRERRMKRNLHKIVSLLVVFLLSVTSLWAANIPTGTKLYLKPNDNWKADKARFAAYFFYKKDNKTYDAWASMQETDCSGVYEVTAPTRNSQNENYTTVIFCRMKPNNQTNNWSNKWNQTADLSWDGTQSLYTVKDGTWDNGGGTWSTVATYIAGNGKSDNAWCNGVDWKADESKNKLVDGKISFTNLPAGDYEFKIVDKTCWYGYTDNFDAANSTESDYISYINTQNDDIKITTTECSDITVNFNSSTKKITVTASFHESKYYLMGADTDGDGNTDNNWVPDPNFELTPKSDDANKLVLLGASIPAVNSIKIVKKSLCGDLFFANVEIVSPVPYSGGGDNNITLQKGTYDFYFDKTKKEIYIGGYVDDAQTVLLDPQVESGGTWDVDGARFAVYYYKDGTNPVEYGWVSADKCNSYYYAQIPAGYDRYIWVRLASGSTKNSFDDDVKWNQTASIKCDAENTLTKLTGMEKSSYQAPYNGACGENYDNLNCEFPEIEDDTVYVHINQFVQSDPCNYVFNSFEQAFAVLKTNNEISSAKTAYYGSLKEDEITLKVPVVMLVHYGPTYYRGIEKVGMSGGHINDAPAIFIRNINPNGDGKTLVVRTADPKGNRAVLVHPVIRRSTNIVLDNLDIISDKNLRDNALDIDTGKGDETLEYTDGADKNFNIVPLPTIDSHITLKNCYVESYGRNGIHVVGIKGLLVENNEFYTKYDFTDVTVSDEEKYDVVDWGGTIKFINCTDVKFLRNNSEGTLATSFFIQGCQRMLIMNNVFWNDNKVEVPGLNGKDRTVANVRLINYVDNPNIEKAKDFPVKNIGIFYNTFFIRSNDSQSASDSYVRFDFFRLGGYKQPVIEDNVGNKYFDPKTIRFWYNNCYSYDKDIVGNNYDSSNKTTFYLQGIGIDNNWCQCFKYNNFWSQYDKEKGNSSSGFEIGKFCTGINETYNLYLNVANQVCKTNPTNPSALVVVTDSLNIGTVISEDEDVSLQGASTFFNDRYNPDNGENAIRPKMSVDNSNEALSPYDKIYNEPGTINLYTSPIVGSQTTDVMVTSIKLTPKSDVDLSIVDKNDDPIADGRFAITDAEGTTIAALTTDLNGSLENKPIYVTFVRPKDVASNIEYVTYEAFLKIVPKQEEDAHLVLRIPLRGHYKTKLEKIGGAWTLGAYQQRAAQPLDTIIWHGSSSTYWDDRSNWYRPDGKLVTCLDALTTNLTVIIPKKNSERFVTPPEGITQYPSLPAIKALDEFGKDRTEKWHGEQVNAGSNTSEETKKVAHKIHMEYGAALVGVEELNSGGVSRYDEVEQEFIARRDDWLLVGTVVKPWVTDELGNIVDTRLIKSGDYYKGHLPHVYMHEAVVKDGNATWLNSFADLNIPVPADRAYAIRIPDQYGPFKLPADFYNMDENTNYDPTEPVTFTFKGRFYNEDKIPTYEKLTPEKTEILSNTYPANINAYELRKSRVGTIQVYDYTHGFQTVAEDSKDALIQSQHGFVFTPAEGVTTLEVGKQYMTNSEVTHRSAEVEIPYVRVEMQNVYNHASNNVYIQFDAEKVDAPNGVVDAPKLFTGENIYLPDLYVMRYGESYSGLSIPTFDEPIPLGVIIGAENQTYIISIVSDNMPSDVMLDDRKTGKIYNLSQGEVCVVDDLPVDTCENRFYLQFVDRMPEDDDVVTSVTDTEADAKDITIYTEQDDIVVSSTPNVELQRIVVVDMAGKHQVYNVSGRYAALSLPLNRGIYTVHVIGDNAVKTEKVHIY